MTHYLSDDELEILGRAKPPFTQNHIHRLLEIKDEYCKPHHGKYAEDAEYA
jgi:hypothetical protein